MDIARIDIQQIEDQGFNFKNGTIAFGTIPLIIKGVVNRWEAFSKWNPKYLSRKYGNTQVECFVVSVRKGQFLQQSNLKEKMQFSSFLTLISDQHSGDGNLRYLRIDTTHPLFRQLSNYFKIPDFLDNYKPEYSGIWMGQKGNLTPFHHDWWHSCLAQIAGAKRFLLIHPFEMANLISNWENSAKYDLSPAPHYSFDDEQLKTIHVHYRGILHPGELLYIPPFWYHQVETMEDANISIPLRYQCKQTPDVPLFQLSQDSGLRALTNQKVADKDQIIKYLVNNRKRFFEREKEFVEAIVKTRDLKLPATKLLEFIKNKKMQKV